MASRVRRHLDMCLVAARSTCDLPDVASRLVAVLRPDGVWYMSFKIGKGERANVGRLFVDHTEDTLTAMLDDLSVEIVETWRYRTDPARSCQGGVAQRHRQTSRPALGGPT